MGNYLRFWRYLLPFLTHYNAADKAAATITFKNQSVSVKTTDHWSVGVPKVAHFCAILETINMPKSVEFCVANGAN